MCGQCHDDENEKHEGTKAASSWARVFVITFDDGYLKCTWSVLCK